MWYEVVLKHLPGKHVQSTHAGSMGSGKLVISASEVADFVKDSKYKRPLYTGGSESRRERLVTGNFDPEKAGSNVWQGSGIYLTNQEAVASQFGTPIKTAVNLKNPFVGTAETIEKKIASFNLQPPRVKLPDGTKLDVRAWTTPGKHMAALRNKWLSSGFDGIVQKSGNQDVVAVFNPESIRVVE